MEHGKAALIESFLRHTVNHETLVIRRGVPKPSMCANLFCRELTHTLSISTKSQETVPNLKGH